MNEIILTTPAQLKEIVKECLADLKQTNQSVPESISPEFLYSLKDLATFLGCSLVTAQKLKNSGKIRFKQFGRKCVFNTAEILEDLNYKQRRVK